MTLYFLNIDGRFTAHEEIVTCFYTVFLCLGLDKTQETIAVIWRL